MNTPTKGKPGRPKKGVHFPRPFPFKVDRPPALPEHLAVFAEWYSLDPNGKRAAEKAGISEGTAGKRAVEWLRRDNVRAYLHALQSEIDATGTVLLPGSREWIRARYISIASVSAADLLTRDEITGQLRWKLPDELSPAQRAAIADVELRTIAPKSTRKASRNSTRENGDESGQVQRDATDAEGARIVVTGYKLHSAAAALDALAKVEGMMRPADTAPREVNVRHVFEAVARSEDTSETSARIRSAHGTAGAVIEGEAAEVRPLRRLRGV